MGLFSPEDLAAINRQAKVHPNATARSLFFRGTGIPGDLSLSLSLAARDPDPEARRAAAALAAAARSVLQLPPPPPSLASLGYWWPGKRGDRTIEMSMKGT